MSENMYIFLKCKSTFSASANYVQEKCPECNGRLVKLGMLAHDWRANSKEEKQQIKEEFFSSIDERMNNLVVSQENKTDELIAEMLETIPPEESLYVALKGREREYLFCTDKMVYIKKKGFMTGHRFGSGSFKMDYNNITNVEVDFHISSGYFELSSAGLQNKPLDVWKNGELDPMKVPNAISLVGKDQKEVFEKASRFIMQKVVETHSPLQSHQTQSMDSTSVQSSVAQIREFKQLLDEGIITQEEFDAKKKQLLNLQS